MTDTLILKADGPVAEIILNNPSRRNAMKGDMWTAISAACARIGAMESVRAVILHGGECGHFSAGADMSEFDAAFADRSAAETSCQAISDASRAIEACPKPVIAAIEGTCMGGALALAAASDLRVVAEGAAFSLPPAKLGVAYPIEDLRRLADILGPARVRELFLTARVFQADEADRFGFVTRRVPTGSAARIAAEMAADMTRLSGWSLSAGKTMLAAIAAGQRTESDAMASLFLEGFLGPDFKEGYRAFLDKRAPDFS
ncbi:MAG: enoyl-CoA hydratase-related protein [Pseudomonadota bacterium]